jgi:hypothetical protein
VKNNRIVSTVGVEEVEKEQARREKRKEKREGIKKAVEANAKPAGKVHRRATAVPEPVSVWL